MSRRPIRAGRPTRRSQARRLTLESLEVRELLTGFMVTNTADNGDNNHPTAGSLRAAIVGSNNNQVVGGNTISFALGSGVQTINLVASLPPITETLVLDGEGPGYNGSPLVVIDGSGAGPGAIGLDFTSAGANVVRGIAIVGFTTNTAQGGAAIYLGGAGSSTIEANYIGVEADGTTAKANSSGIVVFSPNNTIGGATSPNGNVISGNTNAGLLLVGQGATNNVVEGNKIGTNAAGSAAIGNTYGILVTGPNNVIGGTSSGASNLISGNVGPLGQTGVGILFEGTATATGEVVEGNKIGTDFSGTNPIGNVYGIYFGTPGASPAEVIAQTTIGGTTSGAGNLISGNFIGITGNTTATLIAGNLIGLDAAGTAVLPNGDGLLLGATASTIGGTTAAARNVISGNNPLVGDVGTGLDLTGDSDLIEGNYVGTSIAGDGSSGFGNVVGMALHLSNSTIGGTTSAASNVVSGNKDDGIRLLGNTQGGVEVSENTGNSLFGNLIGQAVGGISLPNAGNGIVVTVTTPSGTPPTIPLALNDAIGGTTTGAGNIIAGNAEAGIIVHNTYATGVTGLGIRGNVIQSNGKLGIDLPGIGTPLPSTLFINGAKVVSGKVTVSGVYFGLPSTVYGLDLFANASDPSGYGQGPVYLGTLNVTTNGSGFASFSGTYNEPSAAYTSFTATSTGPEGNTQEFSANYPLLVTGPSAELNLLSTAASSTVTAGTPFTLTETIVNDGPNAANGVVFYDSLPTTLVNPSVTTNVGTATIDGNNVVTANIGTLASGQSVTLTITVTASQQGTFVDSPGVSSTTFDPNYSDNTSSQTITVNPATAGPSADLGITEVASTPALVGSNLTYTIKVTNDGPNLATNPTVNDFLPSGVTFVSATPSQGAAATVGNGFVTDNLGTIAPGGTATLAIVVTPKATGSIVNSANVSGNQFDANSANNATTLTTTVGAATPRINLILAQSTYPQKSVVGSNVIFTMTVTNHGPDAATNVTLIDALPAGVTFVNAAPTQGGFASLVNGVLTDDFGTIAAGASATLTLVVKPNTPGLFVNYAGAYSADLPADPFSFAYGAVSVPTGPSVIGVAKTNASKQIVVAFDAGLTASSATSKANYQLYSLGTTGKAAKKAIPITAVSYNASNNLVTITPSQAISPTTYYQLVVVGSTKTGITDTLGRRLVNPQYSTPGANYTVNFYGGTLASF